MQIDKSVTVVISMMRGAKGDKVNFRHVLLSLNGLVGDIRLSVHKNRNLTYLVDYGSLGKRLSMHFLTPVKWNQITVS